jgi:4-carboxymuconolactone decarboxylase
MTTTPDVSSPTLSSLDEATRELVVVAALVAAGSESEVRAALTRAHAIVPHQWIEELLLQTYLFAGFPRALNSLREWRRLVPTPAATEADTVTGDWRAAGEATCRRVYGRMYDKLRENIAALQPAIDDWMIVEGYGKVLSRPGLDLGRRELCVVAACVASGQERQLHSHLHGALNVGVPAAVVGKAIEALRSVVAGSSIDRAQMLFARVTGNVERKRGDEGAATAGRRTVK